MPTPRAEAFELASRYGLALGAPRRGLIGELLGRGTGGSLEFEDRRPWRVGDDVRRIDWRALARSEQLLVRTFREEISPRVELVLDASRSLAVEPEKAQLAVDLAALLATAARASGFQVALIASGERAEPIDLDRFARHGLECTARESLVPELDGLLRPGALRIVLSDFLLPTELAGRLKRLAQRAGSLAFVQVLGRFDLEPRAGEALRLVDAESGRELDLVLDEAALRGYRERFARLCAELEQQAQRLHAPHAKLVAGVALGAACAQELAPRGLLAPR